MLIMLVANCAGAERTRGRWHRHAGWLERGSILIPAQRQTHGRIALRAGYRVGAVWVVVGAVGMNPRSAVRGGR